MRFVIILAAALAFPAIGAAKGATTRIEIARGKHPLVTLTGEQSAGQFTIWSGPGTSITAADGTVEKLFHSNAGGNTVYVRSPDRATIFYYAHLDRYADGLREGQAVTQGQTLGAVGSTGDASPDAPHLHFEIMQTIPDAKWYESATSVDPYPLLTGKQP